MNHELLKSPPKDTKMTIHRAGDSLVVTIPRRRSFRKESVPVSAGQLCGWIVVLSLLAYAITAFAASRDGYDAGLITGFAVFMLFIVTPICFLVMMFTKKEKPETEPTELTYVFYEDRVERGGYPMRYYPAEPFVSEPCVHTPTDKTGEIVVYVPVYMTYERDTGVSEEPECEEIVCESEEEAAWLLAEMKSFLCDSATSALKKAPERTRKDGASNRPERTECR